MKRFVLYQLLFFVLIISGNAQENLTPGRSKSKRITWQPVVETKAVKSLPDLVISDYDFTDENGNMMIDADENCTFSFKLFNQGEGTARGVVFITSLMNPVNGITFTPGINIGDVESGQIVEIEIPVKTNLELPGGSAGFRFEATEANGFDAYPIEMTIATNRFEAPNVKVVDAIFSTNQGGKVELNYPINLKILVQNIGKGEAKNVKAEFLFLQENCVILDKANQFEIGNLEPGQAVELDFLFTATRRYSLEQIPLKIELSEKYRDYAADTIVSVSLKQNLQARREVVIEGMQTESGEIIIASLLPDVDLNIPVDSIKYPNKYALVIGNEDYKSKQRGIASESDVIFARRDAEIFREYLVHTLGFMDENVFLLKDATAAEMLRYIDLLTKLSERTIGAEIVFYYAGHGFPDEVNRMPYLIPVDVTGTNLSSAIQLTELYKKLESTNAEKISIFLDACFSGAGRSGELYAGRGIRVRPKLEIPGENTIIFSASTGEQSALPYTHKQHGIFTYYLLKKLQDTSGDVTYGELADYLQIRVSLQSLKVNQKVQDPEILFGGGNKSIWINKPLK